MNPRILMVLTLLVLSSILPNSRAIVLETEKQVDVIVTTDDMVYEPGEVLTIMLNLSNSGNKTVFLKEARIVVVAESWLGVTGHDETRSITVPMVRGERDFCFPLRLRSGERGRVVFKRLFNPCGLWDGLCEQ